MYLILGNINRINGAFNCLDENNQPIDNWVSLSQNYNYQYYWHDPDKGFIKSIYSTLQTTNGNIMSTVNQLYATDLNLDNVAYALYNDDPPPPEGTASSTYAHAKGMLLFDNERGFWLVHSKPNWPNGRATGAGPFPDTTYAQSLMCMTFNTSTFNSIASTLMISYPYIYDKYISTNLETIVPDFVTWINYGKSTQLNATNIIKSTGGKEYTQFAKNKLWGRDLYEDFVAPVLNESLYVETWRNGAGGRYARMTDRHCTSSSSSSYRSSCEVVGVVYEHIIFIITNINVFVCIVYYILQNE